MSHSTNVVVSLGSHVHQVFHTGRAQIIPVKSATEMKTTPTSPAEWARLSHLRSRLIRYMTLPTNTKKKAKNDIMATGTWR